MADFVSLAALKLALDVTDASVDVQLASLNAVATALMIDFMNRDPRPDDFTERANGLGSKDLLVLEYPITAVKSVTITGVSNPEVLERSKFDFDDNLIWRTDGGGFPRGRRNVTVKYTAGIDPAPKTWSQAAIYTVRALLTARKVDLNSSGESWAGVSSQTWSADGPGTVPLAAKTFLENYRRRWNG